MQQLKQARDNCKIGYEMYSLYCKVNNMILFLEGKEEKRSIKVDYKSIDNVDALIKLSNCLNIFSQFEEELKELQNALDDKLLEYKKYVIYYQELNKPLDEKYYNHILESIEKIKGLNNNK